ncbi:MAG: hypothetical protein WA082_02580 [Candidatus Moraniibacteriota bacterium]
MQFIFGILYTLFFMSFLVMALFIVFHLLRYSLNQKVSVFGTIFFVVVFTILLFSNAMLFFSIPIGDLLPLGSL